LLSEVIGFAVVQAFVGQQVVCRHKAAFQPGGERLDSGGG
jgi:hypothetical protein